MRNCFVKKKALIISNSFGSIANFRFELVEKLSNDGYSIFACFPYEKNDKKYELPGTKTIDIKMETNKTNVLSDIYLLIQYIKIIKRINPDIVLSYTIKPNIYGSIAAILMKKDIIISITGLGKGMDNEGILHFITVSLYRLICKKVKCVFFQNENNLAYFQKNKIIMKKYKIVSGSGVNLNKYQILPYPTGEDLCFVMICRIMKEKGVYEYIEAAKRVKKVYPNFTFYLVGKCDDEEIMQAIIKEDKEGIIRFEGHQDNVTNYYRKCSCVIHPSYYPEGMSNVVLEASASARPVITTFNPGCCEAIEDEKTGYLCKVKDADDLTRKILKFINLSYAQKKEMGLNARKKMEIDFNRDTVIKNYLEEINRV